MNKLDNKRNQKSRNMTSYQSPVVMRKANRKKKMMYLGASVCNRYIHNKFMLQLNRQFCFGIVNFTSEFSLHYVFVTLIQ